MSSQQQGPSVWGTVKPFVNGGVAGMASISIIQPIDMVKVRIQLGATGSPLTVAVEIVKSSGVGAMYTDLTLLTNDWFTVAVEIVKYSGVGVIYKGLTLLTNNWFTVAGEIVKSSGVGALYKGLSASLMRQGTYTTARMGIFQSITTSLKERNGGAPIPLWQKALAGLTAGGMGALVGNPSDLALVRMQADATLPAEQKRNYKNVFDALIRIVRDEGAGGLLRGAGPTMSRAMALNMGQLASNDQAKQMLDSAGCCLHGF
eukprot:gene30096-35061_t